MGTNKIDQYICAGWFGKEWFSNHRAVLVQMFGETRLKLVTELLAATSINSSLQSNVRLFRRALHEIENGLEFGAYLPVIKRQLERIRAGEPLSGRKIRSFAAAMQGDPDAVVVDIWLLRAFSIENRYFKQQDGRERSGGATDAQYNLIEGYVRQRAPDLGLLPAQLSAILWCGTRYVYTGSKQTNYLELLQYQMYNMYEQNHIQPQ